MTTIVYIDEQEEEIHDFQDYFDNYADEINVVPFNPKGRPIEEVVNDVIESKCSLVAIDFYLKYSDKENSYNGDELLSRIRDRKLNLPLLIFTSNIKKAEDDGFLSPDTKICEKKVINNPDDPTFKNFVLEHINYYETLKLKYKDEFANLRLRQSQGEKLSGRDKLRIIELNNILEEMSDRQFLIKPIENQHEEFTQLSKLIGLTEQILNEIKNK